MSIKQQEPSIAGIGQSPGCDPKTSKRSSGLFSFFKWFKPSTSRESVTQEASPSSSCDSLNSINSTGTIASFSFIPPGDYKIEVTEKNIVPGPETDTYKARLKQRDKRREHDKDLTLRKKYNLFFNRETIVRPSTSLLEETDNSKSLPLMTRKTMEAEEEKSHRRTNSESSKLKRAGAYCHVKGKRKAPQPPVTKSIQDGNSTMSLRRKKRLAPQPPTVVTPEKVINSLENADKYGTIEYADADVIFNDCLKLDHGILRPTKEQESTTNLSKSPRSSYMEAPVSPRPWYKRNLSRDSGIIAKKEKDASKTEDKYEPIERFPDVQFSRNSNITDFTIEEPVKQVKGKKDDKRKSGISFLTNISELDREASEIIKKEHQNEIKELEPPLFMRPKQEQTKTNNSDSWVSPKRKSARDLIARFNAITNVTKVTVNSAFFGTKESGAFQKENFKRDYFGKPASISEEETSKQTKTEVSERQLHVKDVEETGKRLIDDNKNKIPLMKSESAVVIKNNKSETKETPKFDRKSWFCPKCSLENDYWRIICYVCSTIKPYFDDLTTPPAKNNTLEKNKTQISEIKHFPPSTSSDTTKNTTQVKPASDVHLFDRHLERSKTQIGFSALAKYNETQEKHKFVKSASVDEKPKLQTPADKQEERERLKKMLIEMKNSLPKRRFSQPEKQNNRTSIIQEKPENADPETADSAIKQPELENKPASEVKESDELLNDEEEPFPEKNEEKKAEIVVATQETIYENIKVKKSEIPKPIKVSSSAQTNALVRKSVFIPGTSGAVQKQEVKSNFELMRPKDFANIYNVKTEKPDQHIYANLMESSDLFLNMPAKFTEIKNNLANNTDTLEINRLLKRLETAIAKGELSEASNLARELAQLKVSCSVVRQKSVDGQENSKTKPGFMVNMYVEDKVSHRGPFPINVAEEQTVVQLKMQVQNEFQIPVQVQRWILGKELASDDNATLKDLHVTTDGCPIFLYLVAPANDLKLEKDVKIDEVKLTVTAIPSNSKNSSIIDTSASDQQKPSTSAKTTLQELKIEISSNNNQTKTCPTEQIAPIKILPNTSKSETNQLQFDLTSHTEVKLATDDEIEDYDSKTLKPPDKNWECVMCTFLNPQSSNVCAICATVRRITVSPSKITTHKKKKAPQPTNQQKKEQHYLQLLNLDNADLVENMEPFECLVCLTEIAPHEGVTLRECLHQFCRPCLAHTVEFTEEAEVKCPYRDNQYSCDISLQDREIKALVTPTVYDLFLTKSITQAENKIDKSFHCKTPDCKGWCIFEDNVNEFHCPVCRKTNCLTCQAIHMGVNCKQYQESINESATDEDAKRTKEMLEEMVNKGEAIKCPTCQVILMKKWGCDWLRCSMCKTEICWVTRGPRWGPAGKGDTSGGCQCGVNGVKCHPQCNYCH
ncbi:hypothetical protein ILUMI_06289 [Ignelater luminosus]|uniref:RanBP-type and C3HC4-type zinc finger-containing protein 1 n=1 Tax=Ignelater luminosus TaxID=2038154 RepID=A0A8K0GHW5_IGNLU|nr:hypothetical protein ILUMI_06289 [Ignelater luminosus]